MPFSSLVNATIETTLNKLISLGHDSDAALDALSGHVIHIQLNEYKEPLFFYIANRRIEVLGSYEGEASVTLGLGIDTLIALKNKQNISELIKREQLVIDGDIKVLQRFADLLTDLDIDWAEHLSAYTGDVLAHRLSNNAKKLATAVQAQSVNSKHALADYLKHEAKLTISPLEFIHFSDQVESLSQQVEKIAQTISQLEKS